MMGRTLKKGDVFTPGEHMGNLISCSSLDTGPGRGLHYPVLYNVQYASTEQTACKTA
jgi:hypothetical protein